MQTPYIGLSSREYFFNTFILLFHEFETVKNVSLVICVCIYLIEFLSNDL